MVCGWLTPTELKDEDPHITNMKALSDGGGAYIIYNANHANEYYLIENRQKINWDAQLPGSGVLILHVDYDQTVWDNNVVNTVGSDNDHQRLTIFHADNDDDKAIGVPGITLIAKQPNMATLIHIMETIV